MPHSYILRQLLFRPRGRLCKQARAAGLNGLNLGLGPGQTAEACGKLGAIEELALLGLDGAQGSTGVTANGAVEGGATEGTVLLSLSTVGGERVRERAGGRGGVNTRRVVNGLWEEVSLVSGLELGQGFDVLGTERLPIK